MVSGVVLVVLVFIAKLTNALSGQEECATIGCVGEQFVCEHGECYCAPGYVVATSNQADCVRCPGVGESCFGFCCNYRGNNSIQCWHGECKHCYDRHRNWICNDGFDQMMLMSISQVVMASALVLGIVAIFVLLYRLCAVTTVRPIGRLSQRLSIGSLQLYVEERLRDAPPSYSRTTATATSVSIIPVSSLYINSGFTHDSTVPPPPYSAKKDDIPEQILPQHI